MAPSMTVNLLTHTDLFRPASPERRVQPLADGAFGSRTNAGRWRRPRLREGLAVLHVNALKRPPRFFSSDGSGDANPGSATTQSELLYEASAQRRAGPLVCCVRVHGYSALESNEHVVAEQIAWLTVCEERAAPAGEGR